MSSVAELESIAVAVASAAVRSVAAARPAHGSVATKSSDTDLVTDVDRATEKALIAAIRARRPDDAIGGEVGGINRPAGGEWANRPATGVEWVIDPIDGTVNFVLGLPMFAVSVAARVDGRLVAGCVVDAARGEIFHARAGGGAFAITDGVRRRLAGPRRVPLAQAVIGTGFNYAAEVRARHGAAVAGVLARVGNLRRLGSAALDLCCVAAGRLDAYYEGGTADWDRAAGMLIATEAGVRVGGLSGRALEHTVLAAGPEMYDELARLLVEVGAERVLEG